MFKAISSFFSSSPVYQVDTQRLVKIWFSSNPEIFLNKENKARLIKVRDANPRATISLVYDSQLLNDKSITELLSYCQQYNLTGVDIRALAVDLSPQETRLMEIYEDEVKHLDEGGNLGASSDIMRLMSFIRRLGIYSDFDVDVNMSHLPPVVELNAPILLPISFSADEAQIFINNDVLIIAPHPEAERIITDIQKQIIARYAVEEGMKPRQVRHRCLEETRSISSFHQSLCPENRLSEAVWVASMAKILRAAFPNIPESQENDRHLVEYYKEMTLTRTIIDSIVSSTGPKVYLHVLQDKPIGFFNALGAGYSLGHLRTYSLHSHAQLSQGFISPQLIQGMHPSTQCSGDVSYTPHGQLAQKQREERAGAQDEDNVNVITNGSQFTI